MKITSVYIHIPFCLRKCNYCDFVSVPIEEHRAERDAYAALLLKELALFEGEADFSQVQTVYFGGGTPSLMEAQEIGEILSRFSSATETTLEANPETLDPGRLADFRRVGINRMSLGVQSFNPLFLREMGRGHSPEQAVAMVKAAKKEGFDNIGIDLIYGPPGQSLTDWQDDVQKALDLDIRHISLYGLTIEEDTPWGCLVKAGKLTPADDDLGAEMLELAITALECAGFRHYEISNFAKPGFESRHNLAYWRRENYLGLGVAAASCFLNRRMYNQTGLEKYQKMLEEGKRPLMDEESLGIDQVISEAIFLGLRLTAGIDFSAFAAQYGVDPRKRYKKEIAKMTEAGLLVLDAQGMRLTHRGLLLGNEVFRTFI